MLPFCGYNMGDYFRHWLSIGKKLKSPPRIYSVNWFRMDENGKFIWPGFGENIRVLKWIIDRANNQAGAKETPVGLIPELKDLNLNGLNIPEDKLNRLFEVNNPEWKTELQDIEKFLSRFGDRIPFELWQEYNKLSKNLTS